MPAWSPARQQAVAKGVRVSLVPELVYVSTRLAEDVVRRAGRHDLLPINDPYTLAVTAGRLSSDSTGTLEEPDEFVMAPLPLLAWTFRYKEDSRKVAWIVADLGSTLIVLCGSAANFVDHAPEEPSDGWWPSSPIGMQRVVNALTGKPPAGGVLFALEGEAARAAAGSAAYCSLGLPRSAAVDLGISAVMLRRYADVSDVVEGPPFVGHRRRFERVVVGAPLLVQRLPAD